MVERFALTSGEGPLALVFLANNIRCKIRKGKKDLLIGAGDAGRFGFDVAFLLPISKDAFFYNGFELEGLFAAGLALGVVP